jgi:hypothetical protein
MILYANGCSMTYGDEIGDDLLTFSSSNPNLSPLSQAEHRAYRERHSYPAFVAKRMSIPRVINAAARGASNDRIVRTSIADLLKLRADHPATKIHALIGWSATSRREIFIGNEERYFDLHAGHKKNANQEIDIMHRMIFGHFSGEQEERDRFLTQAVSLQAVCDTLDVGYAACFCVGRYRSGDPLLKHLRNTFDIEDFMTFTKTKKIRTGKNNHPLEEGHALWADLIFDYIIDNDFWCI